MNLVQQTLPGFLQQAEPHPCKLAIFATQDYLQLLRETNVFLINVSHQVSHDGQSLVTIMSVQDHKVTPCAYMIADTTNEKIYIKYFMVSGKKSVSFSFVKLILLQWLKLSMGLVADPQIAFHALDKEACAAWIQVFPCCLIHHDSAKFFEANSDKLVELQCGGIVPVLLEKLRSLVAAETSTEFETKTDAFVNTWVPVIPQYIRYFINTWIGAFPPSSWTDYSNNEIPNSQAGIFHVLALSPSLQ
jgi:hypothetical protein